MTDHSVDVDPDVASVVATWRPAERVDDELLRLVLPLARTWVTSAGPSSVSDARRWLQPTTAILVWVHTTIGTVDVATVLNPHNVELWVAVVNKSRSCVWRQTTRGVLRRVGRAANPDGWPVTPQAFGRPTGSVPYDNNEERTFKLLAGLPDHEDRAARLWVTAASLGAGLTGAELVAAHTKDVIEQPDGLTIQVRGRHARLTPVRRAWVDTVTNAIKATKATGPAGHATRERFVTAEGRNAIYGIVERLAPVNGQPLSLRRARSTWLAAHLTAGTALPTLRIIAGPVSTATLDRLITVTAETLDRDTAYRQGFDA